MKLPQQAIDEYQKIHLNEFGEELTDEEAEVHARRIFTFFESLFNLTNDR